MTKAEMVIKISYEVNLDKEEILKILDSFTSIVKKTLINNKEVTLRGFGTFTNKYRAKKIGRNISKNISVVIPPHYIPVFKPAKEFTESVKKNVSYPS